MSAWRKIKTVPKDGTRVLLSSPDADKTANPFIGSWRDDEGMPDGGAWWERDDARFPIDAADPSHWMPLPDPPVAA